MKLRLIVVTSLVAAQPAVAGGLFVPGAGVKSSSRAGAAVASADDGEALAVNPAGLAKSHGTSITVSATFLTYFMSFHRAGRYDQQTDTPTDLPWENTRYPTITNDPKPPLGIGRFQPLPVVAVVSDLGGVVPNLHVAAGLFTPQGYPFRDMSNGYKFQTVEANVPGAGAPPPSRYDVLEQEAALLLPSVAAAYRVHPNLDLGARFSAGNFTNKTTVAVWGVPTSVEESILTDSMFTADVKDSFVPTFGLGLAYRPTPEIEIGASYTSPIVIDAKGTAVTASGPDVTLNGNPIEVGPVPDAMAACAPGGTMAEQKACISLQLPQTATVGARYKFFGDDHGYYGDLEFDVAWENWGKSCDYTKASLDAGTDCTSPQQYKVTIDSGLYTNGSFAQAFEKSVINLGLKDTLSFRLGGSYELPQGEPTAARRWIIRYGVAYDTRAAKTGWLRANQDGASRITTTAGAAYHAKKWEVSAGAGFIYEGSNTNPNSGVGGTLCNPTLAQITCTADGNQRPNDQRQGPDPTNPLVPAEFQFENPVAQGTYKSSYLQFMFGYSRWF